MIGLSPLLGIYLMLFGAGVLLDLVLTGMNMRHLKEKGHAVPEPFKGHVDRTRLGTMCDYTLANQKFGIWMSCISAMVFLMILLSGILPTLVQWIQHFNVGTIFSGLLFFAILAVGQTLFSLPFDYYKTFVIENRHGFNTSTRKRWVVDLLKSFIVTIILGGCLATAVLALIEYGGRLWWLWAWIVFFLFQILMLLLYPTVIAPWFNTFIPLEDNALVEKVRGVMKKGGLSVGGVFKMDAGTRSRHTNAYFTGIGKTKRIVLFDTLLAAHDDDEILAILAHEIGHWRKRHVQKMLVLVGGLSLILFYMASLSMQWIALHQAFGFDKPFTYVGLFLFGIWWAAVSPFFSPVSNLVSRGHEREADAFAVGLLGKSTALIRALKKLAKDNLSNLYPHPLYAWFHYSHPPLLERIRHLHEINAGNGR